MKHLTWLLLLLASLAAAACDEPADTAPTGPNTSAIPLEPGVFPNAIGTIWIYRVHNPESGSDDTVEIRVTDTLPTKDGHLASVWSLFLKNHLLRVEYVAAFGDTVMFYWPSSRPGPAQQPVLWPGQFFLFPSPVGSTWPSFNSDSAIVTGHVSLDIPAGHFDDVTEINNALFMRNPPSLLWVKEHTGIIKMFNDSTWLLHAWNEEWTLIRFIP